MTGDYVVAGVAYSRIRTRTRLLVSLTKSILLHFMLLFTFYHSYRCYASLILFNFIIYSFVSAILANFVSMPLFPTLWILILVLCSTFVCPAWNRRRFMYCLSLYVSWTCRRYYKYYLDYIMTIGVACVRISPVQFFLSCYPR